MNEEVREARRSEREAQQREREAQRELDKCQRATNKANRYARISNRVMGVAVAIAVASWWALSNAHDDIQRLTDSVAIKEGMMISQNISIDRLRKSVDYERNKSGRLSGRVDVLEDAIETIRGHILADDPQACPPLMIRKGEVQP